MRVIIVSDARFWGGLEVHTVALAEALVAADHETSIVGIGDRACELYRQKAPERVRLIDLGAPAERTILSWLRTFRNIEADAAVLEKGTLWTGGLALDFALRLRFGQYFTIQQLPPPEIPARTSNRYWGGILPGIGLWWYRWKWSGYARSLAPKLTICVSDSVRHQLASNYAFPPRRLVTIRNGVDADRFRPNPQVRQSVRRSWGVPDDAFVFGSVARLSRQKALDIAIEAFSHVSARSPDRSLRLVLVGEGDERANLSALIERLNLGDRVVLPGFASNPADVYQGLDVFLIPSRFEGLPFALVEAMASSCLIIGTPVGGIPEAVPDGRVGTLVPAQDSFALADAMVRALTLDPSARAAQSIAARQHVIDNFDLRRNCNKIISLLAAPRASPRQASE
jgi:glycosyltransferase involved in cell wall biosynthesis